MCDKQDKEKDKEYWKSIIYKDGKIDEFTVMIELLDYSFILSQVSKVYCAVTNGRLSKPNYYAETVLTEFEDLHYDKKYVQDDIKQILQTKNESDVEKLEEIRKYFEIGDSDMSENISRECQLKAERLQFGR